MQHGIVPAGKNRLQRDLDELARTNPAVARAAAEVDRVTAEILANRRCVYCGSPSHESDLCDAQEPGDPGWA